ncbi:gametocyte-specific factor 1 [Bombina bombina]|uniref:gametocyte-specific factor 1 n=1 Tax=Bombina bombina TaxID=8345 RepID=UPI00235B0EB3|nr:gametocyte-specific factor 1 [Bombina bombina]
MESEDLVQCPYDKNHMIRYSRFPYHLVKCRENNPGMAKKLVSCPYNARHRVPKQELELHMSTCESKCQEDLPELQYFVTEQANNALSAQKNFPTCEENWEDEDESVAAPFVLYEYGNCSPYDLPKESKNKPCYYPDGDPNMSGFALQPNSSQFGKSSTDSEFNNYNPQTTNMPNQKPQVQNPVPRMDNPWMKEPRQLVAVEPKSFSYSGQTEQWPRATNIPNQKMSVWNDKSQVQNPVSRMDNPWMKQPRQPVAVEPKSFSYSGQTEQLPRTTNMPNQKMSLWNGKPQVQNPVPRMDNPWMKEPRQPAADETKSFSYSGQTEHWPRLTKDLKPRHK